MNKPPASNDTSESELIWAGRKYFLLLRCWTMPVESVPLDNESIDVRTSVKAAALALIVILVFAYRPDLNPENELLYSSATAGITITLSVLLQIVTNYIREHIAIFPRDKMLITGYGSLISVLFFAIVFNIYGGEINIYQVYADKLGFGLFSVIMATVVSFLLLIMKSIIIDKGKPVFTAMVHSIVVIVLSGLVVLLISYINNDVFKYFFA